MWEKLYDLISKVFTLTIRIERLEKDFEKLQREIEELTKIVNKHSLQMEILARTINDEREKTILFVENQLLKFERRLPSGKEEKGNEED